MSEDKPSYKVEAVANFFIEKGLEDNNPVNPMKLQKLLYYAYGWYFAFFDKKLFEENIEAWKYGPVIPKIYHEVKEYGNYHITAPISNFLIGDESTIFSLKYNTPKLEPKNDEEAKFFNSLWQSLSKYEAIPLSNATHAEGTPWETTVKPHNGNIPHGLVIDDTLIRDFFKQKIEK